VLSACQTGLGEITKNEGIIGLTRAFQYAGAQSVVVSLWKITDSSSKLMKEFYRQYKNGRSKDVALQLAQASLIKPEFSHPYYWAAFQMVGQWRSH
jgi:CHAT domain-containing protein